MAAAETALAAGRTLPDGFGAEIKDGPALAERCRCATRVAPAALPTIPPISKPNATSGRARRPPGRLSLENSSGGMRGGGPAGGHGGGAGAAGMRGGGPAGGHGGGAWAGGPGE